MQIMFECISCTKLLAPRRYEAVFAAMPDRCPKVVMMFETPVVPGTFYELLLKGVYPGACEGRPCVSNMLRFDRQTNEKLEACEWAKVQMEMEGESKKV